MDLDVVGVAVVAVPVIDREDVGGLVAQDVGEPSGRLVEPACRKRLGSVFCSQPVIPESWYPSQTTRSMPSARGRLRRLTPASVDQRLAGRQVVRHLAVLTVGRDDEDDAVSLRVCPRHCAAGRQSPRRRDGRGSRRAFPLTPA